jgi:hypothetical protein
MIYPLVRELATEKIPVAVTCRVLGFSKHASVKRCPGSGPPVTLTGCVDTFAGLALLADS